MSVQRVHRWTRAIAGSNAYTQADLAEHASSAIEDKVAWFAELDNLVAILRVQYSCQVNIPARLRNLASLGIPEPNATKFTSPSEHDKFN